MDVLSLAGVTPPVVIGPDANREPYSVLGLDLGYPKYRLVPSGSFSRTGLSAI